MINQIGFFDIVLNPIFSNKIIFIIYLLILIIIFFSVTNKIANSFTRVIILFIFTLIILQPSIKIEKGKVQKSILTFVIDNTDSQKLSSRHNLYKKIYENILKKVEKDKKFFDILEIAVDNEKYARRFGSVEKIRDSKNKPTYIYHKNDSSTKMLDYILSEVNKFPVKKMSSIFFFTDGQIHENKDEWKKKQFDIPSYFIIPNSNLFNDTRLDLGSFPEYVEVGEEVELDVTASIFGKRKKDNLTLTIFGSSEETRSIKFEGNETKKVRLKVNKPGENFYIFNLSSKGGEVSLSNNQKIIKINASRKKLKVLLISGEPYLGTRVWRNFLKSDPAVQLIHMTVLRPPEKIDSTEMKELSLIPFPVRELFEKKIKNFNLVIFDNFKGKNILTPLYFQNLIKFVESGGAILEITGPSYNSRSSLFRTEIGRVLPGIPSGKSLRGEFKPILTKLGTKHPITRSLFEDYQEYGKWYEMNQVTIDEEDTSILMTGIQNNPLLAIKNIDKGRIAQIYSHHIWLWKNISSEKGPYKKLIRNLAHWLMQEPKLEADRLEISNDDKFIYIDKKNFKNIGSYEDSVVVIGPEGNKSKIKLLKIDQENSKAKFRYNKDGYYLLFNKSLVKKFMTPDFSSRELTDIHLNEFFLNQIKISGLLTKIIKTYDGSDLNIEKINKKEIDKKDFKRNLYLPFNYEFRVNEIKNINLYNRNLLVILIIILLIYLWKKESKKRA